MPYSPGDMFDLVADVERYPEFLPHCAALRVTSRNVAKGSGELEADMIVSYAAFRERFRSRVRLDRPALAIDVDYVDGPFRKLQNRWRFHELPKPESGSEIDFTIDFEFRSFLFEAAARGAFERVFTRMSDAFVSRAESVYAATRD